MQILDYLYRWMDAVLMPLYRLPDTPLLGFYASAFFLSTVCIVIGQCSISLSFRLNKENFLRNSRDAVHFHTLSIKALQAGDRAAYRACNRAANEAFAKTFFHNIAFSVASYWPLFMTIGWLEDRFSGIEITIPFSMPMADGTVSCLAIYLLCYVASHIVVKNLRGLVRVPSAHLSAEKEFRQ